MPTGHTTMPWLGYGPNFGPCARNPFSFSKLFSTL
jgi:hypothetical protein